MRWVEMGFDVMVPTYLSIPLANSRIDCILPDKMAVDCVSFR
jgi:hypothetical protein